MTLLTKYRLHPNTSVSLKYDPMGNRVLKLFTDSEGTATQKYIVDVAGKLPTILMEIDANTNDVLSTYIYSDNSGIIAQRDGNCVADKYFYVTDRLGSVRQIVKIVLNIRLQTNGQSN